MQSCSLRLLPLALVCASSLTSQPVDNTQLKQVIIFGPDSLRAPVAAGLSTHSGEELETILGEYYRQWLTEEGLLTGDDPADADFVFFHANAIQRTVDTAQHLWSGMLPEAPINVQYLTPSTASDPLFDPAGAGAAPLDSETAIASINGRLADNLQSLASAYAPEFALIRSVLFGNPAGEIPPPTLTALTKLTDFTNYPITVPPGSKEAPISLGELSTPGIAIDPFVTEDADALQIDWSQLNSGGVSQTSRIHKLILDLELATPHPARVPSSNLASHIVRSMLQAATGNVMTGTLGTPSTKIVVLIASAVNVCGLAGLFHIDWQVQGYPPDYCDPGGALVLELRQSQSTGEYLIRASRIAQTLDQLRNLPP